MGELIPINKSQSILGGASLFKFREALKSDNDGDRVMLETLYVTTHDPLQIILIEAVCQLKGYDLPLIGNDPPEKMVG